MSRDRVDALILWALVSVPLLCMIASIVESALTP